MAPRPPPAPRRPRARPPSSPIGRTGCRASCAARRPQEHPPSASRSSARARSPRSPADHPPAACRECLSATVALAARTAQGSARTPRSFQTLPFESLNHRSVSTGIRFMGPEPRTRSRSFDLNDTAAISTLEPVSFRLYGADFAAFAEALGRSFARYGFAVISDHGLDQARIDAALSDTKAFFA